MKPFNEMGNSVKFVMVILVSLVTVIYGSACYANYPPSSAFTSKTTAADTLKRVKKKSRPERRSARKEKRKSYKSEEPEKSSSCLGTVLSIFLESLCSSIFSGGNDEPAAENNIIYEEPEYGKPLQEGEVTEKEQQPAESTAFGLQRGSDDAVLISSPPGSDIVLWSNAGGLGSDGYSIATLKEETSIQINYTSKVHGDLWYNISVPSSSNLTGWVKENEILISSEVKEKISEEELYFENKIKLDNYYEPDYYSPEAETTSPQPVEDYAVQESVRHEVADIRFQITASPGVSVIARSMLSEEYGNPQFSMALKTRYVPRYPFTVGLQLSYLHANGEPLYQYKSGDIVQRPDSSDIDIVSLGLHAGIIHQISSRPFFISLEFAPTLFWVRESAHYHIYDRGMLVKLKEDRFTKPTIGSNLCLGFGYQSKNATYALNVTYSYIAWDPKGEEPLTLDFLNRDSIPIIRFAFSVGYTFFK